MKSNILLQKSQKAFKLSKKLMIESLSSFSEEEKIRARQTGECWATNQIKDAVYRYLFKTYPASYDIIWTDDLIKFIKINRPRSNLIMQKFSSFEFQKICHDKFIPYYNKYFVKWYIKLHWCDFVDGFVFYNKEVRKFYEYSKN